MAYDVHLTHVFATVSCLRGVYIPAYSPMLAAPRLVVSVLVCGEGTFEKIAVSNKSRCVDQFGKACPNRSL